MTATASEIRNSTVRIVLARISAHPVENLKEEGHDTGRGDRERHKARSAAPAARPDLPERVAPRGARPSLSRARTATRDQRARYAHDEQKLEKIVIADEQPRGSDQLDIAAAEKAAPEQQKRRDKKGSARGERIESRARVSG